jgi:hypothetical protein
MPQWERDVKLEKILLTAVIAEQNERPRTKQRLVGPSEVGGCRELLRSKFFEPAEDDAPEEHWSLAAHIGTVMGDELERIFGKRLDAVTQQRVTVTLEQLGVQVSGASDLIWVEGDVVSNLVGDLKSTAAMGSVLYEGPKLAYLIQIALYVMGLVQSGVLAPGATGRIIYYDRTGDVQEFVAIIVPWEAIQNFYMLAQQRLREVVAAQKAFEQSGDMEQIHRLRDFTPSFCFSAKVECPRRFKCWGGSSWAPEELLRDPNHLSAAKRYIEGRKLETMGKNMKAEARTELVGIEGRFEEGPMVSWPAGRINVVDAGPLPTEGS